MVRGRGNEEHALVKNVQAFVTAPTAFKHKINQSVYKKNYPANSHVIRSGETGRAMYYLLSGACSAQSAPGELPHAMLQHIKSFLAPKIQRQERSQSTESFFLAACLGRWLSLSRGRTPRRMLT